MFNRIINKIEILVIGYLIMIVKWGVLIELYN